MSIIKDIRDVLQGKISIKNKRSSKWAKVRKGYLKFNPRCAVCESKKKIEVHHLMPFQLRSDLELDEKNLITLCESKKSVNCHLLFGHGLNYRDYNPDCPKDVEHFHDLIKNCQLKK